MVAELKAALAAVKAKVAAVDAYVAAHYKQLLAAAVAGKFSSELLSVALALVHKL